MKNIPKGTWEKNPIIETNEYGSQCIDIDTEQFGSQVSVWFDETIESEKLEADSVASLICDAGNTYNQTQLTPSEILAQRNELLELVKELINEFGIFANVPENYKELEGYPGDENPRTLAIQKAYSLISKIENP